MQIDNKIKPGDRVIIRDANFRKVSESRNLRGILDYSRVHAVERVDLYGPASDGGGQLGVAWANGATTICGFSDHGVMCKWVKARRCFAGVPVREHVRGNHAA